MRYTEKGYREIERGVFVKTYEPFEDGTLATDKQKNAIKNMLAFLKSGDKDNHKCLSKKEIADINKLTKVQGMKEVSALIESIKNREDELLEAWADMPW